MRPKKTFLLSLLLGTTLFAGSLHFGGAIAADSPAENETCGSCHNGFSNSTSVFFNSTSAFSNHTSARENETPPVSGTPAGASGGLVVQPAADCTFVITPTGKGYPSGQGAGTIKVTTQTGCAWTAVSNDAWIVLKSGGGTGSGSVSYSLGRNLGYIERVGTITAAGQTFTVTQAASPFPPIVFSPPASLPPAHTGSGYSFDFASVSPPSGGDGGPYHFELGTMGGFPPMGLVLAPNGLLSGTVSSPAGTRPTKYSFTVCAVDLGGRKKCKKVSITLSGADISPKGKAAAASGGSGSFSVRVTPATGFNWTAASNSSWIDATGAGADSGTVLYSVAPNTLYEKRTGSITVSFDSGEATTERVFTITQAEKKKLNLPEGFPENAPPGSYVITTQVCAPYIGCSSYGAEYTMNNASITTFANAIVSALKKATAPPGSGCTTSLSFTQWNGSYFQANWSVTCCAGNPQVCGTATVVIRATRK